MPTRVAKIDITPLPARLVRAAMAPATLFERTRGRKRWLLAWAYLAVLGVVGALAYRQSRLVGLPDIGDPFDPAPLLDLRVPETDNAFTYFHRATAKVYHDRETELRICNSPYAWPPASDTQAHAYLDRNAEALDLWRRGTDCDEALERPIGELTIDTPLPTIQEHRNFVRLAALRANKARAEGDPAGAWRWLRAILRGSRQIGTHGTAIARLVGTSEYSMAVSVVRPWMTDPATPDDLVRDALREVRRINAMTTPDSSALQVEYLCVMQTIDDPAKLWQFLMEDPWSMKLVDGTDLTNHLGFLQHLRRFLENEPERSRRMLRLAFANWLAHCDRPPADRPPLVGPTGVTPGPPPRGNQAPIPWLYDGTTPGGVDPRILADRLRTSWLALAQLTAYDGVQKAYDRDRTQRGSLVMSLAEEVYRRDHGGAEPASPRDLIGTALDRFPPEYTPPAE